MRGWILVGALFGVLCFCPVPASADIITIDFEAFSDGDAVETPATGVTVTNATALTAGVSLNDFDFPPHSGEDVIVDSGGAISFTFDIPLISFTGYFTYIAPLTLTAYDSSNSLLGSISSSFSENYLSSGNTPNELLGLSSLLGIASVIITGSELGGSFVLDDVTLTTPDTESVPEPSTLTLLALGAAWSSLQALRKRSQMLGSRQA